MASGDSTENDDDYVMYKDRNQWKDITPIKQNDGVHPVVKIAYTEEFEDVYGYFRAIVAKGELSERALELTKDAIDLNAANYTVWQYRRKIIEHIKYDLWTELDFCRIMIELNPKNYQVWHHRRVIVESLGDPSKELRLTEIVLSSDAKNYHAWEHRQWVLDTFNLFDNELNYIEELLKDDIRNNSAWNQRFFVISRTTGFSDDVIEREIDFAKTAVIKLPNNESSWNYLRGIIGQSSRRLSDMTDFENWCWEFVRRSENGCPLVLVFLLDVLEDRLGVLDSAAKKSCLEQALKLCQSLSEKHDTIRREYWNHTARRLTSKGEA